LFRRALLGRIGDLLIPVPASAAGAAAPCGAPWRPPRRHA